MAVFVTVVAAAWLQLELGGGLGQPFFAVIIALYAVGAHASWPSTFVGPASVVLQAVLVDMPRLRDGAPWDEVVPAWFILLGVWGFGRWMHLRAQAAVGVDRARRGGRTGSGARRRHGRWPRSGLVLLASCTTWSRTAWA